MLAPNLRTIHQRASWRSSRKTSNEPIYLRPQIHRLISQILLIPIPPLISTIYCSGGSEIQWISIYPYATGLTTSISVSLPPLPPRSLSLSNAFWKLNVGPNPLRSYVG